jgi:ATP-binding cassette subfamily B protein
MAYFWGGTDFLIFGQYALTAGVGIVFVINGDLQTGQFIAFLSLLGLIVWPIRQLGRIIADFGKTTVALDRIEEILSQVSEHENDAVGTPEIKGNIRFENVSFQFSDDTKHLLENVSFEVKKGERVAIIGKTGSGKSTLLKLLLRLYDIDEGVITIDGVNIQDINKKHLRKHVGMVLQEPFLYSRSVYENLSIMNRKASPSQIEGVANIASVHLDIKQFEKGYETVVGERGVTLSGGQKQRLAIARMLLDQKPVLMFDDSLSAVDTETDRKIREALETTWKDATVFMITHRITTAMEADKIFVLEDGKIIQSGTHESLILEEGLYARLWQIQANIKHQTTNEEVSL